MQITVWAGGMVLCVYFVLIWGKSSVFSIISVASYLSIMHFRKAEIKKGQQCPHLPSVMVGCQYNRVYTENKYMKKKQCVFWV